MISTHGILQDVDPAQWVVHRFGIPVARWHSLQGRSFWVTGAGSGYGRCISVALAAAGAQVFLTGRRRAKLEDTLREMSSLGIGTDHCRLLPADITDPAAVTEAASSIRNTCSHLYGLVHGAALPQPVQDSRALLRVSEDQWRNMMDTNVTGAWRVSREALTHMVKGGALRMLFLTSEAGWAFTPGFGPYNVSKAALNNLGASFAHEVESFYEGADVQINILNPGEARTEMNQGSNISPYSVVCMVLALLSHPSDGPNGRFFHRDGRHLSFAYASEYEKQIL